MTHTEYMKVWRQKNPDYYKSKKWKKYKRKHQREYRKNHPTYGKTLLDLERHRIVCKRYKKSTKGKIQSAKERKIYKKQIKARAILNQAIKQGLIKRLPCEVCRTSKTESHHQNYDKPLDVKWLCFKHHRELERGMLND